MTKSSREQVEAHILGPHDPKLKDRVRAAKNIAAAREIKARMITDPGKKAEIYRKYRREPPPKYRLFSLEHIKSLTSHKATSSKESQS